MKLRIFSVPCLLAFVVKLCRPNVVRNKPAFHLETPWLKNISFQWCGKGSLESFVPQAEMWCKHLEPYFPVHIQCEFKLTPRKDIFSAYFAAEIYLDGNFLASLKDETDRTCPRLGFGPCPWFANVTYSGSYTWKGRLLQLPEGHYAGMIVLSNQDNVEEFCIKVKADAVDSRESY